MFLHVQLDGSERVTGLQEFEEMVRDGTIGPETPVRAEPLTGDRWMPAYTLELYQGLSASAEALVRRALASPAVPWFTAILVGLELRIYFWTHNTRIEPQLWQRFAKNSPAIFENGEYSRLITHAFLHGSLGHVVMNMLFIAYIGIALEGVLGSLGLGVLFLSSVFWGGVLSAIFLPEAWSIGASSGDFGFLAAAAVFGLRYSDLLPARARPRFGFVMLLYLLYLLIPGLTTQQDFNDKEGGVDNWGHIGGLIAGGVHMAFLRPNVGAVWKAHNRRVTAVAVALIGVAVVGMARLPLPLVPVQEDGLVASRPVWWKPGWAAIGDRAWASPIGGGQLVARTVHHDLPVPLTAAVDELVDAYREVDPEAVVETPTEVERDGVAGRQLRIHFDLSGKPRRVDAQVFTRGRYEHRIFLEVPLDMPGLSGRVSNLAPRVFGGLSFPLPEEVAEAQAATGGWRGRLAQAEGAADLGDLPTARAQIDAALGEAPGEPAPVQALLELVTLYPDPSVPALTDQALAKFPSDSRIREAAVRALVASGHPELAARRLEERLAEAPGDRRMVRLREELFEE